MNLPLTNSEFPDLMKVCDTLKYGGQMDMPETILPMAQSDLNAVAALVAIAHPSTFRNFNLAKTFLQRSVSHCLEDEKNRAQLIAAQPTESNSHISKGVWGLNTFHKFPELPVELRLVVWETSIPKSRVVELFWIHQNGCDIVLKVEHRELLNLRRACRESKGVVDKKYQLMQRRALRSIHLSVSSAVLVDYRTGIFYSPHAIHINHFYMNTTALQQSAIHTVALPTAHSHHFYQRPLFSDTIWVEHFPQLREVMWVFPEDDDRDKGTEMILIEAKNSPKREQVKKRFSDEWKAFMASRDNPEALGRIKMVYKEIKRPNPRDLLVRDFEALIARHQVG